jgi:hypothetical protein
VCSRRPSNFGCRPLKLTVRARLRGTVPRLMTVAAAAALLGIGIPAAVLFIDHLSPHGWWPRWISFVWPSNYMLMAADGRPGFLFEAIAISTTVNAVLYALLAILLASIYRRL